MRGLKYLGRNHHATGRSTNKSGRMTKETTTNIFVHKNSKLTDMYRCVSPDSLPKRQITFLIRRFAKNNLTHKYYIMYGTHALLHLKRWTLTEGTIAIRCLKDAYLQPPPTDITSINLDVSFVAPFILRLERPCPIQTSLSPLRSLHHRQSVNAFSITRSIVS